MNIKAFPHTWQTERGTQMTNYGMELRDYFAAKIMQGLMLDKDTWFDTWEQLCKSAYCKADDMMEARKK